MSQTQTIINKSVVTPRLFPVFHPRKTKAHRIRNRFISLVLLTLLPVIDRYKHITSNLILFGDHSLFAGSIRLTDNEK